MNLFDLYLKMKIIKIKVIIITVNIVKKSILINEEENNLQLQISAFYDYNEGKEAETVL